MSKPVLVVFSRDQQLTSELPPLFRGQVEVRACDTMEEMLDLVRGVEPQGLVADFRRTGGGGHFEDRLLGVMRDRFPGLRVAMLTGNPCPEPLERRAACHEVAHLRAPVALRQLAEVFRSLYAKEVEPEPEIPTAAESVSPPEAEESDVVLNGISRRFETQSPQLRQMLLDLEVAARHDVTILLIGETGSGKTYLSRLIHEISPRRNEPFLPVACGALPSDLIESELFGHVKGAFTSAHADKDGKFLAARRGTILLDEIDVLGLEQQVKLLRVIETGEFEAVGSNHTHRSQARLVAASNLDLQPLVEKGRFRPDLYYRLNMLKFEVPPLRHRKADIVSLAKKFIRQQTQKHGVKIDQVDPDVYGSLVSYPWPGNVRELENVIQRAVIYCREGVLTPRHLPVHIVSGTAGPTNDPSVILSPASPLKAPHSLENQIAQSEREIIEQSLFKNSFSRTRTARDLGISRVTLYNKMKKYGITR